MKKYLIKCNGKNIGETDLEFVDETMGMHFGKFYPGELYSEFQSLFRDAFKKQNWDNLTFKIISSSTNRDLMFNFVWISDDPDFPEDIEITVNVNSEDEKYN